MTEKLRQEISQAIIGVLDGQEVMHCDRDWTAWAYGTMSADDFTLVSEDALSIEEFTEAVMTVLRDNAVELLTDALFSERKQDGAVDN